LNQDIKILVVDDDPDILFATSRVIRKAGFNVLEANSGSECLNKAKKYKPDLIFSDVMLPDILGTELCKKIKSDPFFKGTFFILISGKKISSDEQAEGLDHGADGYIARPISNRELLSRISSIVRILVAERKLDRLVVELQDTLKKVKTLSGLLPLCSHCKNIRDDKGYWNEIENFIEEHSDIDFSHSICPKCAEKHYPEMGLYDDE
jgi:response regulator RpfG family c-di-GMP phosphodiesterase